MQSKESREASTATYDMSQCGRVTDSLGRIVARLLFECEAMNPVQLLRIQVRALPRLFQLHTQSGCQEILSQPSPASYALIYVEVDGKSGRLAAQYIA